MGKKGGRKGEKEGGRGGDGGETVCRGDDVIKISTDREREEGEEGEQEGGKKEGWREEKKEEVQKRMREMDEKGRKSGTEMINK